MPSPRAVAWCLLLIALSAVAAPLVAGDGCDDPCGSHCGDCAWCPVTADLSSADDAFRMSSVDLGPGADRRSQLVLPRALDHVPLPAG